MEEKGVVGGWGGCDEDIDVGGCGEGENWIAGEMVLELHGLSFINRGLIYFGQRIIVL